MISKIHALTKINRLYETNVSTKGRPMKIIAYRNVRSIDIKFDDDTILINRSYKDFKKGCVLHPDDDKYEDKTYETNISTKGRPMKIIAYRGSKSIDVEFDDGTIVKNREYSDFKNGSISYPEVKDRKDETNISTKGLTMKIIAYRNSKSIDVQFDDGKIVKDKEYRDFKKGMIMHPDDKASINAIGKTNKNTQGLSMLVIGYRIKNSIDLKFETGAIVTNVSYSYFKAGKTAHPKYCGHIKIGKIAYRTYSEINFYCYCEKCMKNDVMTYQEMQAHVCN